MKEKSRIARLAPVFIIVGASCWGFIGLFTKHLYGAGCFAVQVAFLRSFIAALLLWLFLLIFDRDKLKIKLRDLWMFFGTGVLSLVLFSVMYFKTQQETTLSVAAVLLYTAPCFVILMSAVFFKEKITGRMLIALVLAVAGCVCTTGLIESLMTGSVGRLSVAGILTGIGSGFGYALYSIFANVALKKYSSITVTAYTFMFSALALLPFCVGTGLFSLLEKPEVWKNAIGIAVFSTILPYALYTLGLKYTEPGKASVMAFSEPVVATLIGVFVFREAMTAGGVAGIMLIFLSILLLNTGGKKPHKKSSCHTSGDSF